MNNTPSSFEGDRHDNHGHGSGDGDERSDDEESEDRYEGDFKRRRRMPRPPEIVVEKGELKCERFVSDSSDSVSVPRTMPSLERRHEDARASFASDVVLKGETRPPRLTGFDMSPISSPSKATTTTSHSHSKLPARFRGGGGVVDASGGAGTGAGAGASTSTDSPRARVQSFGKAAYRAYHNDKPSPYARSRYVGSGGGTVVLQQVFNFIQSPIMKGRSASPSPSPSLSPSPRTRRGRVGRWERERERQRRQQQQEESSNNNIRGRFDACEAKTCDRGRLSHR